MAKDTPQEAVDHSKRDKLPTLADMEYDYSGKVVGRNIERRIRTRLAYWEGLFPVPAHKLKEFEIKHGSIEKIRGRIAEDRAILGEPFTEKVHQKKKGESGKK